MIKHIESKDDEIPDMTINIGVIHITTDTPNCMTMEKLQQAMTEGDLLQQLGEHIIRGWPKAKMRYDKKKIILDIQR